jgi:hypothetical protein
MGLDDPVRSNILSMEPLPSLNKVYSMVIQEERRISVARGKEERCEVVGFAVQVTKPRDGMQVDCRQSKTRSSDRPICFLEGWGHRDRVSRSGRGGGHGGRDHGASANAVQGTSSSTNLLENNKQESQPFTGSMTLLNNLFHRSILRIQV